MTDLDLEPDLDHQVDYWSTTGAGKTFTHPVEPEWLSEIELSARILDFGCGYGRLSGELHGRGYEAVEGIDFSPALIDRARTQWPGLSFSVVDTAGRLPYPDESFDAVLLFAVLTCIPTDAGQSALIDELHRLLRPGAVLYLSDWCLQSDERNRERYGVFAEKYGTYGVFETGDGAVCRHHDPAWLRDLLSGFDPVAERGLSVRTMNGNPAEVTQFLVRKAME
jgi:SAM-dependent methyltransferase